MSASAAPAHHFTSTVLCGSCYSDVDRPCAIYKLVDCSECTDLTIECCICEGRGTDQEIVEDGSYPDCEACGGSGFRAVCHACHGESYTDRNGNERRVPCKTCSQTGQVRCETCDGTGVIQELQYFCPGDNEDPDSQRPHASAMGLEPGEWSWVEAEH